MAFCKGINIETFWRSPALITETECPKILSGALKKLPDKVQPRTQALYLRPALRERPWLREPPDFRGKSN